MPAGSNQYANRNGDAAVTRRSVSLACLLIGEWREGVWPWDQPQELHLKIEKEKKTASYLICPLSIVPKETLMKARDGDFSTVTSRAEVYVCAT